MNILIILGCDTHIVGRVMYYSVLQRTIASLTTVILDHEYFSCNQWYTFQEIFTAYKEQKMQRRQLYASSVICTVYCIEVIFGTVCVLVCVIYVALPLDCTLWYSGCCWWWRNEQHCPCRDCSLLLVLGSPDANLPAKHTYTLFFLFKDNHFSLEIYRNIRAHPLCSFPFIP